MILETAQRILDKNATEDDLIKAFNGDQACGEFIILSKADQVFIQASGGSGEPYMIDFCEGDANHYCQSLEPVEKSKTLAIFLKYLNSDASWKSDLSWDRFENKPWWKIW